MTTPSDPFADDAGRSASRAGSEEQGALTGCEWFDSVSAELALGSLSGAARSAALGHLDTCEPCRALVEDLSTAADALLLVAPEVDPPAGFEVRLLARLKAGETTTESPVAPVIHLRRRMRMAVAAAAAAIVIAGAGVGIGVAVAPRATQSTAAGQVRVATLRSASETVGSVVLTGGRPSWVLMTLHRPGWSGWVYCIVTENGQSKRIGSFWVHDGLGSWAVQLGSSSSSITSAQVESPDGSVYATAAFAS
jgi:hypothetical protein